MNFPYPKRRGTIAFSLVEVVLALGICTFVLIAVLGLFATGLQSNRESEQEIQAANLASMLITLRTASPTNDIPKLANFAIPTSAMTNLYTNAYNGGSSLTNYIGLDGQLTNAANAAYAISCRAGTSFQTGSGLSQIYLMLSWPPQMNPTSASAGRYEIMAYVPIR
jgi:type II secretory pathway pseudopilin PulG